MYIPKSSGYWEKINNYTYSIKETDGNAEIMRIADRSSWGIYTDIKGQAATGKSLFLYPNQTDDYPHIQISGVDHLSIQLEEDHALKILEEGNELWRFSHDKGDKINIQMKETANNPSNRLGWGQLYTKSDNKLYFIDGNGTTHTLN